jgi:DNA ligase-1
MNPMLAADCLGKPEKIKLPAFLSPKLDGFRAIITTDQEVVTRNLKPVPNLFVRETLRGSVPGLDGEIVVGDPRDTRSLGSTSSGITTRKGEPDFTFWVFDRQPVVPWGKKSEMVLNFIPYSQRLLFLQSMKPSGRIKLLPQVLAHTLEEVLEYEDRCLAEGYEGIMARGPDSPYKDGRATLNEGWLTKLKRFIDTEVEVTGLYELEHNENVATRNALGHTQRSTHKAGKRASGMLGGYNVRLIRDVPLPDGRTLKKGLAFDVGGGPAFTKAERIRLWGLGDQALGKIGKVKFFPVGIDKKPKWPTWLGFKFKGDM